MQTAALGFRRAVLASLGVMLGTAGTAWAADLGPARAPVVATQAPVPPSWTYRFTPYGWLTAMNGTQTVRGRSAKVNASFVDIVEKSDTLVGLMGDLEARNGPFALMDNVVWSSIGFERNDVRTRTPAPSVKTAVGRALGRAPGRRCGFQRADAVPRYCHAAEDGLIRSVRDHRAGPRGCETLDREEGTA